MRIFTAFITVITFLLILPLAQAETNILVIIDGSNSMWGQIDKKAKIETAQETLSKLISDMPADANLALMAYGHTKEKDCNDVELLSPVGKNQSKSIVKLIHAIQPKGKTPIANALVKSKDVFKGLEGQNNHILLVSDGIESCDGDPCAVAKSLQEAGLNVSAHVIGFGVSKEEGKQLTCIAENTGGKYFDVADAAAFNEAIKEVTQIAQAEPEPAAPAEPVVWFEDNFDGDDLADHWEVINPDPDSYIVEDHVLMMISSVQSTISDEKMPNLLQYSKDLPKGDWDASVLFTGTLKTGRDQVWIGLRKDHENYVAVSMYTRGKNYNGAHGSDGVELTITRNSKGTKTTHKVNIYNGTNNAKYDAFIERINTQMGILTISKRGRKYFGSFSLANDKGAADVWRTDTLTSLRAPGPLVTGISMWKAIQGEVSVSIDSVNVTLMNESKTKQITE